MSFAFSDTANSSHLTAPRNLRRYAGLVEMPWHKTAELVLRNCRMLLLVGEPGCGKSEAAVSLLTEHNGVEPVVLNGTPETERQDLLGVFTLAAGESRFADFALTRALKEGRSLLINDFGQIPIETNVALLDLRDGRASYSHPVTSEEIRVPADFRIIATANPESLQMSCRRATESAKAILEGFSVIEVPVPTKPQLLAIVKSHLPDAPETFVETGLARWAHFRAIRNEDSTAGLSVRIVLEYVRLRQGGLDDATATRIAFVNKFIYDDSLHSSANLSWSMSHNHSES